MRKRAIGSWSVSRGSLLGCVGLWSGLLLGSCTSSEPVEMTKPVEEMPPKLTWKWDKSLPATASLSWASSSRGLTTLRGIIHLHSVYSHDACDGNPQPGGKPNAPCLANLRRSLCQTRQDFAMLTDHATHMGEAPFEQLLLADAQAGDELVTVTGEPVKAGSEAVGNRLRCDAKVADGQRVLLTAGGENDLMPVGLHHHLGNTETERKRAMSDGSPAAIAAFHAAGGAVLQAHGESRSLADLTALAAAGLDGMEVYNLHANIDPRIRSTHLGLDGLGAVAGLAPWFGGTPVSEGGPEPDLSVLGFLLPNQNQLGKFDALLGAGYRLLPMFGSDIHENSFKTLLADGERGDSYRRLMRWFTNHLLVRGSGPWTPAQLMDAVKSGRGYGVFEVFGSSAGFDFFAEVKAGSGSPASTAEMGEEAPLGATLKLRIPNPLPVGEAVDKRALAVMTAVVLRVAPGESAAKVVRQQQLTASELAAPGGTLLSIATGDTASTGPGAYRVELRITPRYLLHLLGEEFKQYEREYPYLYSGVIYVRASAPQLRLDVRARQQ